MRRRSVIGGAVLAFTSISGCLGKVSTNLGSKPKDDTMTNKINFNRSVSIEQVDSVPSRYPVDLKIEVVQSKITENQTAHLMTTVTNTSNTARKFDLPYYKGASADAGEPGILLYALSAPDSPSAQYAPDCIGTDGKSQNNLKWSNEAIRMISIEPKKSTKEELIVVDDPTTSGCIPTGEYRFESSYNINSSDSNEIGFKWGFTLQIDE
ncbi:hypothetical protein [Haladaptatus sp. DYF46]|uniref:hypothetical protein n=1 Tax=Haladaptatus sp. DYF46 TaxID=2886041 RepID=UPI001E35F63F|nr:hypothetical protein [Haladaptatus sp. DYF46]